MCYFGRVVYGFIVFMKDLKKQKTKKGAYFRKGEFAVSASFALCVPSPYRLRLARTRTDARPRSGFGLSFGPTPSAERQPSSDRDTEIYSGTRVVRSTSSSTVTVGVRPFGTARLDGPALRGPPIDGELCTALLSHPWYVVS